MRLALPLAPLGALASLVLASGCVSSAPSRPAPAVAARPASTARIARGESACLVAGRAGVDAKALLAANGLAQRPELPLPSGAVAIPENAVLRHRVRPGETLYLLARWYGHSPRALASSNRIDDPHRINAGTWLRIPAGARTACPPPAPTLVQARPAVTRQLPKRPNPASGPRSRDESASKQARQKRPPSAATPPAREAKPTAPPPAREPEVAVPEAPPAVAPNAVSVDALARADGWLAQARDRYDAADFEHVLVLTESAQRALPAEADDAASVERRARAGWLAGLAQAGLDRPDAARASLREALALRPELRNDPNVSPRILSLLDAPQEEPRVR